MDVPSYYFCCDPKKFLTKGRSNFSHSFDKSSSRRDSDPIRAALTIFHEGEFDFRKPPEISVALNCVAFRGLYKSSISARG